MRLILDVMCGGLDSYLRMCNHDTVYAGDRGLEADDDLLAVARDERRTIVTRDVDLASRADEPILLESRDVEAQLAALDAAGVDLTLAAEPEFCGRCNGPLGAVDPTESTPDYAPDPAAVETWRCRDCGQYFWRGSHWERVEKTLSRIRTRGGESTDES
ncbi:Mut7-C RNAse domain-containing protein [Natrinema salsiterrestre]|uniref:Mut7-C RNAse domain-containing protein n=1 Tax=Natrinema salsiterrestre TaxID=2950540 RepID=A0A9Q4L5H9_9EURY|nr:Mut7-C RNAse domain-containing protein [Natrinema salsiterrestre]MDF9746892.1 Mut7-C RNAse domain-containing protein [Natrinema salsiterrestre]